MRRLVSWFLHTPTSNTLNVLPAGRAGWVERDGREAACVVRGVCGALFVSAGARKLIPVGMRGSGRAKALEGQGVVGRPHHAAPRARPS